MIGGLFVFLFCNCLASSSKEEDQRCIEKVKEYLKSIKDFDELVSPQSLFLHFLGPKPSTKVLTKIGRASCRERV